MTLLLNQRMDEAGVSTAPPEPFWAESAHLHPLLSLLQRSHLFSTSTHTTSNISNVAPLEEVG